MKIRFITDVSFVLGAYEAGAVLECDAEHGERLITMGLAEAVTGDAGAEKSTPESAMQGAAPETATHPRARPRG
jgi:hypothetical protein